MHNVNFLNNFYILKDNFSLLNWDSLIGLPVNNSKTIDTETIYLDNKKHSLGFDKILYCWKNIDTLVDTYELNEINCGDGINKVLIKDKLSNILKLTSNFTVDNQPLEKLCQTKSSKYYIENKNNKILEIENIYETSYYNELDIKALDLSKYLLVKIQINNSKLGDKIRNILIDAGAIFIPPLFYVFSNELMALLGKQSGQKPYLEYKDLEIEAKLNSTSSNAFGLIYDFINNNGLVGFEIEKGFPHFLSRGLRVCYLKNNKGLFNKIVFYGFKEPAIVKKASMELVKDNKGLNCILSREEIKEEDKVTEEDILKTAGSEAIWLDKRKMVFWIENKITGRVYHVANDKCISNKTNDLSQVEIEYAGTVKKNSPNKQAIIDDITKITSTLLNKFDFLTPTVVRKEEWFV